MDLQQTTSKVQSTFIFQHRRVLGHPQLKRLTRKAALESARRAARSVPTWMEEAFALMIGGRSRDR